ncbi:hypothetical protein FB382_001499 [Nocardioides ginsengisegetis]|uniref:Excreted virulence factor EspC, type VII ESX diderm n=1 Tax=Nocardioides ginsengisegetis TaxID=661491 RepID=A0A7W3IZ13_9ACTN|nr:hypothetical protein [Nocardioides ginsengisegetis]MBA8803208.1 hypothetical protein [Nocardioides ginsengisegetis]
MTTIHSTSVNTEGPGEALQDLARRVQSIHDPREISSVLGSVSAGLAVLAQALHQLGQFHDGPARERAWTNGSSRTGTAASYRVSWELHRAAEIIHQVSTGLDRAHEVEATITYATEHSAELPDVARAVPERGLLL